MKFNLIERMLDELKITKFDICIFGIKITGKKVFDFLTSRNIKVKCFLTDLENFDKTFNGLPVYKINDFLDKNKCDLIFAFDVSDFNMNSLNFCNVNKLYAYDWQGRFPIGVENDNLIDLSWINENKFYLEKIYEKFEDDESRICFVDFLQQRMLSHYNNRCSTYEQYFEPFLDFSDKEVFIDCGAFIGDSVDGFLIALKTRGINTFEKIYALEIDKKNVEIMQHKYKNDNRIECIMKGVWSEQKELSFKKDGESGSGNKLDVFGNEKVCVIDIDTLMNNDVENRGGGYLLRWI